MNCCDEYGNCRQGRDCPVRKQRQQERQHQENVVIYKGNSAVVAWTPDGACRVKGDKLTITATVKEHGVRNGVKQTVI